MPSALLLVALACRPDHQPTGSGDAPADADTDTEVPGPVDADADGVPADLDCDDEDPGVWAPAPETCNGVDDDCDGEADEEPVVGNHYYWDADGDLFGDAAQAFLACVRPAGASYLSGDCDDADPLVNPGEIDFCGDDVDSDCDGVLPTCTFEGDRSLSSAAVRFLSFQGHNLIDALAAPGDITGDGLPDVVIAQNGISWQNHYDGAAFVFSGVGPQSVDETDAVAVLHGPDEDAAAAEALGAVGDINRDGWPDLLVSNDRDESWLVYGPVTGEIDLAGAGAVLPGSQSQGDGIVGLGDLDSDGYGEFCVAEVRADAFGADVGAAWVYEGPLTGRVSSDAAVTSFTSMRSDAYPHDGAVGAAVGVGDWSGDGRSDLALFSIFEGRQTVSIVEEFPSGVVLVSEAHQAWFQNEDREASAGSDFDAAGDVNGDGYEDLLINGETWWDYEGNAGVAVAHLFYGPFTGRSTLSEADFVAEGVQGTEAGNGSSVEGLGDLDGDGYDDIAVGLHFANYDADHWNGAVAIFRGPLEGHQTYWEAETRLWGEGNHDFIAYPRTLLGAGDIDGDGLPDLLVGSVAPYDDSSPAAWLVLGASL